MEQSIQDLHRPRFGNWLLRVAGEWAIISGMFALCAAFRTPWVWVPAMLVVGMRQHALAVLGHDGLHYSACRNLVVNDWAARLLAFWPLGIGLDGFRRFHLAHHRYATHEPDPELVHKAWTGGEWDLPVRRSRLLWFFVRDLLGGGVNDVLFLMKLSAPERWADRVGPLLWMAGMTFVCWRLHFVWFVPFYVISLFTVFWALFHLRAMAEHTGISGTHRTSFPRWWGWLMVPHHIGFHYEHHRWPAMPCSNLPKARAFDTEEPIIPLAELFRSFETKPAFHYGAVPEAQGAIPQPA